MGLKIVRASRVPGTLTKDTYAAKRCPRLVNASCGIHGFLTVGTGCGNRARRGCTRRLQADKRKPAPDSPWNRRGKIRREPCNDVGGASLILAISEKETAHVEPDSYRTTEPEPGSETRPATGRRPTAGPAAAGSKPAGPAEARPVRPVSLEEPRQKRGFFFGFLWRPFSTAALR